MANRKLIWLLLGALLLSLCAGCSGAPRQEDTLTTITVWHVYGGQTDSPLNDLIAQFNQTVGKESGINVQVTSVSMIKTATKSYVYKLQSTADAKDRHFML